MIICVRYFFEKTDEEYQQYNTQWNENVYRMIFLHFYLSKNKQMKTLIQDIQNNIHKDILSIRFPTKNIHNNCIIKKLLNGEGIAYNNGVWYPNEIWIYS